MSLFGDLLQRHESERQGRILADASADRPRFPPDGPDGFLRPAQAASVMEVDEEAVLEMVLNGCLEWKRVGGELLIRPAVVSVLAFRSERSGSD